MLKITLTSKEEKVLKRLHRKSRDGYARERIKSVLHCSSGWSVERIAEALLLDSSTIRRYLNDYQSYKKLKHARKGGASSHLSGFQTEELRGHLRDTLYQHKHQIVSYVKQRWRVKYSISGMQKWLERNGFVYKQPKGVPYKADAKQQESFIEKYEQLKKSATLLNEPILFMDAAHPTQVTKISHGWIEKGQDKVVHTNGSRTRINLIGAIQLGHLDKMVINRFDGTVNGEVICAFLPQIRQQYPQAKNIHLIIDRAGYHRNQIIHDKANDLNIKIHFLPPHSPNLNPIERLWKVMNKNARNNQFFASTKEFRQRIDDFFKSTLPKIAHSLNRTINDNFERIHC